ncbi:probable receptor-like protein kinase At1g80640 isoform X2 [Phragmites australis]|uniref:probable receptor-like protein kinase At1g80640 isoform X2 n=1 Tax=Phragmites australis TaxID=29695 RepID=UPI002D79C58C|nr:probable receptor-like protein kinase At1g80640 isoform X2 [Phragmites australis]
MVSCQKGTDFCVPIVVVAPLCPLQPKSGRERERGAMRSMPPPLPLLCASVLVFLLLLDRPLVANGRAPPPTASSPSQGPSHEPVQQAPSTTNGSVASANGPAAVLHAAAAPPPLVGIVVERHHHLRRELIAAIVLSSVAGITVVFAALYACILWRRSRQALDSKDSQSSDTARIAFVPILNSFNSFKTSKKGAAAMMDYASLEAATGKFSESNVLGVGGFGCVYKANFDGRFAAAVKSLGGGGHDCEKEFENELDLLGSIRHPNIVSLVGFCIHEENRFIVYELMGNGSLDTQLHGPSHGSALSWHIRMKIALDTARGLEYLHEHCNPPMIHRDLKSSNILLDSDFNAKISDFGLAVTSGNHSKGNMKLSGTLGYVAPEYLLHGKLTEKSDVYAFGVVLLELLLGRKPVEKVAQSQCQSIVTWAMPQLTDRSKLPNIIDPMIKNTMDLKHLYQVAAVAVLCVQPEPSYRPLITDVLHSLIPLVPMELGGTMRVGPESPYATQKHSPC